MSYLYNLKKMGFIGALILGVMLLGCTGRGGGSAPPAANPVGEKEATVVVSGNRVDFGQVISGLDSVGIQVRLSNVPAGFAPTVTVKTASGSEKRLVKAAIPFAGVVLAYGGTDLFSVDPFQTLEFSEALPADAVVEIFDANGAQDLAADVRPAFIGFRKRFDISNDQRINTSDLAYVLAWIQTSRSTDLTLVKARSVEIYPPVTGSLATLPAVLGEDLNADTVVDTKDVALALAWIQVGRLSDANLVYTRAREIHPQVTALPTVFPGETVALVIPNLNEIDLGAGIRMYFAGIPSGTFFMGDWAGDRSVTISRPFLMGIFEVTQEQYQQVTSLENPSSFKPYPRRPVEQVCWNGAVQFCNLLSDQQGLERCYTFVATDTLCHYASSGYRLPTEAEWEFACRAGSRSTYYWGESIDGAYCWYNGNSAIAGVLQTHDAGWKLPNQWGLFDMLGNVDEWCQDWSANYPTVAQTDPIGPATGTNRILRGSSAVTSTFGGLRSGSRGGAVPTTLGSYVGFRVVRLRP